LVCPAAAQKAAKPEPAPPPSAAPAYEAPVMRLAELLGALAYLRDLCGGADGADYRVRTQTLMEAERPELREKIAGAFNRGFRGYEASYSVCTENARAIIERYQGEGARIARDLGARYGG
jgi:uncharacterized protein (TIGR02301 family)